MSPFWQKSSDLTFFSISKTVNSKTLFELLSQDLVPGSFFIPKTLDPSPLNKGKVVDPVRSICIYWFGRQIFEFNILYMSIF